MAETYFISYTGRDEEWAKWIAGVLEERGQTVLIQAWDIRAGDNFVSKMNEFVKKCDVCIPVLSQAYLESEFCEEEWTNIYAMAVKGKNKRMIPVRITDVIPDGLFHATVYVDLFHAINAHDEKTAEQLLVEGVSVEKSLRQKPAFPTASAIPRAMFPGTLPSNNLPERNPHFSGREGPLNEIHTQFQSGGAGCIKQTITGLGGVGKTQTATEYAWRFISEYKDAVWLVNAETEIAAFNDCLSFAKAAGLIPENMDETQELTPKQLASYLKSWFASHNSWLFIFDNVENNKVIAPYISGVQTGHLLITTRNRELKQGKSVDIELFTPDEAMQFMRDRLCENINLIDSEPVLTSLVERMNCFPLALEQAGAYIESTNRSCSDYLALLDKRGKLKTLAARQSSPTNYHLAVTETLSLSFDKLGESARQLFNLCTYMSPDEIPLAFFWRQLERLPKPLQEDFGDDFEQDEIIAELLNYSLVKRDGDYLSMHRLIQEIGRDQINDSELDWLGICADAMIEDLREIANYSNYAQREQFARIAGHGAAIAEHAGERYRNDADEADRTVWLYHFIGVGSEALARYDQALMWYQKALMIREETLGKEHLSTAATYNIIAYVCTYQGDYPKALEWNQKALAIHEKVLGREHLTTAATYNDVALVYSHLGDYPRALEWGRKAIEIKEKELGTEHLSTAASYNDVALVCGSQGDYPRALEWFLKASAVFEKELGMEHPYTATTYNNIAYVCSHQGDYTEALEWGLKALAIREKVLGAEHPDTATTYNNIAFIYSHQGNYDQALEWHWKALAIREKVLGKEHRDIAVTYSDVAFIYDSQGDYPKALEWYEKSYRILLYELGNFHPNTKTVKRDMEAAYRSANLDEPFEIWLEKKYGFIAVL